MGEPTDRPSWPFPPSVALWMASPGSCASGVSRVHIVGGDVRAAAGQIPTSVKSGARRVPHFNAQARRAGAPRSIGAKGGRLAARKKSGAAENPPRLRRGGTTQVRGKIRENGSEALGPTFWLASGLVWDSTLWSATCLGLRAPIQHIPPQMDINQRATCRPKRPPCPPAGCNPDQRPPLRKGAWGRLVTSPGWLGAEHRPPLFEFLWALMRTMRRWHLHSCFLDLRRSPP